MIHRQKRPNDNISYARDKKRPAEPGRKELARALAGSAVLVSACSKKDDLCIKKYPKEFCDRGKSSPKIIDHEDGTQTVAGVEDTGKFSGKIEFSYGDLAGVAALVAAALLLNKNLWKYLKKDKKAKNN